MSVPAKSLATYARWQAVLEALDAVVDMSVLPAIVRCPACQEHRLHVHADTVVGGQWAYCRVCQFAGDMIELAAHVWGSSIEDTITRLGCSPPVPPPSTIESQIARYVRHHVRYRTRLRKFWRRAQQKSAGDTIDSVRPMLEAFRLSLAMAGGVSDLRSQFIGITSRRKIENVFQPRSYRPRHRTNRQGDTLLHRSGGAGRNSIFFGDDWGDILVVPYSDLPGRICGFLFVGRNADPAAGDIVFHAANYGHPSRMKEAGLSMWPVLDLPPEEPLGDSLFVITDP